MIQSIKDFWPQLFGNDQQRQPDDNEGEEAAKEYVELLAQNSVP